MAEPHLILGGKVHAYKESWFATDHAAGVSAEIPGTNPRESAYRCAEAKGESLAS